MTNNYREQIAQIFESAEHTLQIAVSWFTDEFLLKKLASIARTKRIELLLSADEINLLRHKHIRDLKNAGALVKKAGSETATTGNFMHSKMVIIDNAFAHGGSYNFTENARSNMENFNRYNDEGANDLKTRYKEWFDQSVDFFSDIHDAESVVNRIKRRFLEEEKLRAGFLSTISKELSERDLIIKQELKKEELRETVQYLSEGTVSLAPCGTLVNSKEGISSKPHKFYGGAVITIFGGEKKKHSYATALIQKKEIESKFAFLKCRIENDTLIVVGFFQPTGCKKYKARIEFRAGNSPQVYIMEPKIVTNADIHIYKEGSLCLFYPGDLKWKDSTSIAEYTIPWIYEWILYFEIYLLTGKWEGLSETHRMRLSSHLS